MVGYDYHFIGNNYHASFSVIEEERKQNVEKRAQHKAKDRSSARDFELTHFWDYNEIMEYVDQVAGEYSNIIKVHKLKDSLQGRRIVNMEITAPGDASGRPIILIDSTIHARWVIVWCPPDPLLISIMIP